jgi:hypothetical protein
MAPLRTSNAASSSRGAFTNRITGLPSAVGEDSRPMHRAEICPRATSVSDANHLGRNWFSTLGQMPWELPYRCGRSVTTTATPVTTSAACQRRIPSPLNSGRSHQGRTAHPRRLTVQLAATEPGWAAVVGERGPVLPWSPEPASWATVGLRFGLNWVFVATLRSDIEPKRRDLQL